MTTDQQLLRRLGKRCRQVRKDRGLSQLDMVRDHGFSLSHYQKVERGALDARLSTLQRVADAFGMDVSELLRGV